MDKGEWIVINNQSDTCFSINLTQEFKAISVLVQVIFHRLVSCTNSDVDKKKVKIAYANWLEGIAMSQSVSVKSVSRDRLICGFHNSCTGIDS